MKSILSFAVAFMLFVSCSNNADKKTDAGISVADTLLNKAEDAPEFTGITDSSKLVIVKRDGKTVSYPGYKDGFKDEMEYSFRRKDIDGDGNDEIIMAYYTGGAHCCLVNTILARTGDYQMQEVLDFTGGTGISVGTVTINFDEALGYFHTCYACGINYPKDVGPTVSFLFKQGKFSFLPTDKQMNEEIEANLQAITSKPIPDKDPAEESGFDDGTRKAIAFNMVPYYYNNQRGLSKTKILFDKYYTHPDKDIIWKDIVKYISYFDEDIQKGILLH